MNKNIFLLFSIFFAGNTAFSQNVVTDTSATVVAYWKKGDKKTYVLKKINEQSSSRGLTKDSASFKISLHVLAETEKSYTIEWRYTTLSLPVIASNEVPGLEALCNNLRIVYTTDETGSFVAVNNLAEIQASMNKVFDLLIKPGQLNAEAAAVTKELRMILSNRQSIEMLVLKDIQAFHRLYGLEYNIVKQTEDTELPNVFGGQPFPAVVSLQLVNIESNKSSFSVEMSSTIDKKVATKMVVDFLNEAGKKSGKTPLKESEFSEMDVKDVYLYTINAESGWITGATTERLVDAAGSYKKEVVNISLQK